MMKNLFKAGLFIFLLLFAPVAKAQADFLFNDAQKPDSFAVPFQIKDSLIQIKAEVNGLEVPFVLDNGCPFLVVNSRYGKSGMQTDSTVKARGVGGAVKAGFVLIDSFNWQGIAKQHFKAVAADLPHLGDSIGGLIGLDVYKDYRVSFDYKMGIILFTKAKPVEEIPDTVMAPVTVPFVFSGHIPVITAMVEQQEIQMGVDCAATSNLLSTLWLSKLKGITDIRSTLLKGGGVALAVVEAVLRQIAVAGVPYRDMKFAFDDAGLRQINSGRDIGMEGLLGIPFLKHYKTVIDFPQRIIEIYPGERE